LKIHEISQTMHDGQRRLDGIGKGSILIAPPGASMIRARDPSRAFLRALACHAVPMAWTTNVETSRLENHSAQDTWVLTIAGRAGGLQPVGETRIMAAGTARVLAVLLHAGDTFALEPGTAVDLEITPEQDAIAIGFSLRGAKDGPASGCRFQVAQSGLAAPAALEVLAECAVVRLEHAHFGYPQEGAWISIVRSH
jgi:hypothetical protein